MKNKITLNENLIGTVGIFASAFIAFFLIPNNTDHFPFLGIALSLVILNTFIFISIQQKTNFQKLLFIFATFTSAFIVFRANGFLTFLNIVTTIYLISFYNLKGSSVLEILLSPILSVLKAVSSTNIYKIDKSKFAFTRNKISKNTIFSGIITIVVLAVMIPILASANPIFENLVNNIIKSLKLEELLKLENLFAWIWRFIVFGFWVSAIPKFIGLVNTTKEDFSETPSELSLFTPKIAVILVLVAFFATQIQLYTASAEILKNLNISNSAQTRAVFTQLSIVALIVFALIYSDKVKKYNNRVATYFLIIEGLFLTAIASYSDYSYITSWGLTHKRLYGVAVIVWIVTAFILFGFKYLKSEINNAFIKNLIAFTGLLIVLINFANFDFLIGNPPTGGLLPKTEQGIDYTYIVYNTSADGRAYDKIVDESYAILKSGRSYASYDWYDIKNSTEKIIGLKKKYYYYAPNDKLNKQFREEFYVYQNKISDFRQINLSELMYISQISSSKIDDLVTKSLEIMDILRPVNTYDTDTTYMQDKQMQEPVEVKIPAPSPINATVKVKMPEQNQEFGN